MPTPKLAHQSNVVKQIKFCEAQASSDHTDTIPHPKNKKKNQVYEHVIKDQWVVI